MDFEEALQVINKDTMDQYEKIRQSGACNMFDRACVAVAAYEKGYLDLAAVALYEDSYKALLMNFSKLMKHYGITQPKGNEA